MTKARSPFNGQYISNYGLQKYRPQPDAAYPLIVLDPQGMPIWHVTEFYRRSKQETRSRTPDTYLDMLLPLIGYQTRHGYDWQAPPDDVRGQIAAFLRRDVRAVLLSDRTLDGYYCTPGSGSLLSRSALGVTLAAITSFYSIMAPEYPFAEHPMISRKAVELKAQASRNIINRGAPDIAGIRSESWLQTNRHPTNFFRLKRAGTPAERYLHHNDECLARIRQSIGWMLEQDRQSITLRDNIILQILRFCGPRLHEVINLTAGGYRRGRQRNSAFVRNKGSYGIEDKVLYLRDSTVMLLDEYIRTERAGHDSAHRCRLDDLRDDDHLFITRSGSPYSTTAFRYHWRMWQQQTQPLFNVICAPHDIRHLFVTENIIDIRHQAQGDQSLEHRLRQDFALVMGWRSTATLATYDHTLHYNAAFERMNSLMHRVERGDLPPLSKYDADICWDMLADDSSTGTTEQEPFWLHTPIE